MQNWNQMPQRPPLGTSSMAQTVKNLPPMQETQVWFLGQEDPLEKGMAIHSSIFAWRFPWTEEPGGLQSMELQRVGHDWVTNTSTFFLCSLYNSSKTVRTEWELLPEVKVTLSHPTPPPVQWKIFMGEKTVFSFHENQFSSDQSLSRVRLFATPGIAARQASLSITNSWSSLKLTSIESVMPSSHLILCRPLLLLPPIPPSIRVFSNESTLRMRWPKYWSFSLSIILSKEHPGLISFRMDWLDLLEVQGTLKSLLQHYSSKASIPWEYHSVKNFINTKKCHARKRGVDPV